MAAKKTTKAPKRKREVIQAELRAVHCDIKRGRATDGKPAWVSANTLAPGYVDIPERPGGPMPWNDLRDSWLAHAVRRCARANHFDAIKVLLCRILREIMLDEDIDRVEAVKDAVFQAFPEVAAISGRKPGLPIDGAKLKTYRKRIKISQEKFAEECNLAVATIQHAEADSALGNRTRDVIAKTLTKLLRHPVTEKDLINSRN